MKINYIEQKAEFTTISKIVKNILITKRLAVNKDDLFIPKVIGIILIGEPGVGKTFMVHELAKLFNTKCFKIPGNQEIDRANMEGYWIMEAGESVFVPGELVNAINYSNTYGISFLDVDEINAIRPSQQLGFNSLTDWQAMVTLISKSGTSFSVNADSLLILIGTMNRDVIGVNMLQEAFYSRFFFVFELGFPEPELEVKIIQNMSGISKEIATGLVDVAQDLRGAFYKEKSVSNLCTPRELISCCQMLRYADESIIDSVIDACLVDKIGIDAREKEKVNSFLLGKNTRNIIKNYIKKDFICIDGILKREEVSKKKEEYVKSISNKITVGYVEKQILKSMYGSWMTVEQLASIIHKDKRGLYQTLTRLLKKGLVIKSRTEVRNKLCFTLSTNGKFYLENEVNS